MNSVIHVDLGERSYPIHVGSGLLETVGDHVHAVNGSRQTLIISDDRVSPLYLKTVTRSLAEKDIPFVEYILPAGESSKSQKHLFEAYDIALDAGMDRHALVIALGGGVVGDLAGYVAASYLRGIKFLQVPTTLLAMVDSSVGGKTGINLPKGKNLIGAFYQPEEVVIDLDTLKTLPPREFNAGMAEIIKYGVIKDASLFEMLEQQAEDVKALNADRIKEIVLRCCQIKADVVQEDEREGGLRAILNFGHTLGHAIEQATAYGSYLHGEAISIGMVYAARVSEALTGFSHDETERLIKLFETFDLPVKRPELDWSELVAAMARDKKSVQKLPRFVLASRIGSVEFGCEVPEDVLESTWNGMDIG